MATADLSSPEKLTLSTSSLFLSALTSTADPGASLPLSHSLLSQNAPLPPVPPDIPDPKLIPNSRFIIDGFRFAGDFSVSYFLSHFHSDHYTGLGPSWCRGIIYCSEITARLLTEILKVPSSLVYPLYLDKTFEIDGWEVNLIDANHCPGAVQFLFRNCGSLKKERYIHTGDVRFNPSMKENDNLLRFIGADAIFLDTTYCNPKFCFSSQEESIDYIVRTIQRIRDEYKGSEEKMLFLIATYVIGKEKILVEIARKCNCLLHVDSRKMQILSILGFSDSGFFTEDLEASDICVVSWNVLGETWPYFRPNFVNMEEIMKERGYTKAVGFVATGWMFETKKEGYAVRVKDPLEIHLVPYSEHSSYSELKEYVRFLRPKRVIPTVGEDIDKSSSKGTIALRKHFAGLVDEMANKHDFLLPFHQKLESEFVNEKVSEEGMKELRNLLPDWVTDSQISSLLQTSRGDTVEAVSEFFERERDFYEEANSCSNDPVTNPQETEPIDLNSFASSQSKVEVSISCPQKLLSQITKLCTPKTPTKGPNKPKKRGSSSQMTKPKKKGKSVAPLQTPIGGKQSTITALFGRVSAASSGQNSSTAGGVLHQNKEDKIDDSETDMDRFLQIISDGMTRESAESLLEKAQGDINLAVEMFYSQKQFLTDKISGKEVSTLKAKVFAPADSDFKNVSLPVEEYEPVMHACWKAGEPAPYLHLARTLNLVEQEKGKIKTTAMFCNMFRSLLALSPEDVLPAVYLCTNKIAPDHENVELNIGGSLVVSALEEALGTSKARIKDLYNTSGDLGDAAQECRQSQSLLAPPRPLSIRGVFHMLRKISSISGSGSAGRKKILVISLLNSCREMEIKYLVRTLVRNLRIGAMMRTILPSLANAVVLNCYSAPEKTINPEALKEQMQVVTSEVTKAYNVLPNLDLLIPSLLSKGNTFSASDLAMIPGTPIPPMLARITNCFTQALKLLQGRAFTCEYKYDGQRAQIHKLEDGSVRIFSRQMKESTSRFPDLVNAIREFCNPAVQTFILDAEVVAIDRKKAKIMSFQELSSRERGSKDASLLLHIIKVDVCIFLFDIMLHDGKRLLDSPLCERRKYLRNLVQEKPGYLQLATEITVEGKEAYANNEHTINKVRSFFEEACNSSCEGIMIKSLDADATYSASNRSDSWLKVKRDYVDGLGDSLDLVPIGAWYGNGRKAGWYSPFLMACYNPEAEEFQSVCRVMSGFSDTFYKEMKEYFSEDKILSKKPPYYQTDESPDFWFVPELVWEIRGADLTISPVHHAAVGLVHPSRGISVRLPRFVRALSDRNSEDCSTAADIASMFKSQNRKMGVTLENQEP
ncbi:DNA ligase [Rhynchospora pubera]|uniref:DNA ligase n=1 Tax=Rhynchospora pubera TaxID=906938 RepID=A0AAV8HXN6_9POAL|nr:DNA ligase [Rhynchospora pubera]